MNPSGVTLKAVLDSHSNTTNVGGTGVPLAVKQAEGQKKEEVPTQESKRKPLNVLILYPDDWRHDTIGKEDSIIQTPFLDSLADRGIRFRQNAVTCSICWVSRASLFTGQWPSRHQSSKLICPHFAAGYVWKESSWPGILQTHGYYIGHVVRKGDSDYRHVPTGCGTGGSVLKHRKAAFDSNMPTLFLCWFHSRFLAPTGQVAILQFQCRSL
jgi:hypothetical protein